MVTVAMVTVAMVTVAMVTVATMSLSTTTWASAGLVSFRRYLPNINVRILFTFSEYYTHSLTISHNLLIFHIFFEYFGLYIL